MEVAQKQPQEKGLAQPQPNLHDRQHDAVHEKFVSETFKQNLDQTGQLAVAVCPVHFGRPQPWQPVAQERWLVFGERLGEVVLCYVSSMTQSKHFHSVPIHNNAWKMMGMLIGRKNLRWMVPEC